MRDSISVNVIAETERMADELARAIRRYPGFGHPPKVGIVKKGKAPRKADITFLAGLPNLESIEWAREIYACNPDTRNIYIPSDNRIPVELISATRNGTFYDAALFTDAEEIHAVLDKTRKAGGIFKPVTIAQIGAGPLGEGFARLASQSPAVGSLLINSSRGKKRVNEVRAICGAGREKIEYIDLEEIAEANPDIVFTMAGVRDRYGRRFNYSAYTKREQTTEIIFQKSRDRMDEVLGALKDFNGAVCIMDNPPEDYCRRRIERFGGIPTKTFSIAIDHSRNVTRLIEELARGLTLQGFIKSTGVSRHLGDKSKAALEDCLAKIGVHNDLTQITREDIRGYHLIGVHGGDSYSLLDSCQVGGVPLVKKLEDAGIKMGEWKRKFDARNADFGLELMKNSNGSSLTEVPSYTLEAVQRIAAYQNEPGVALTLERHYRNNPLWVATNFGNSLLYGPTGVYLTSNVDIESKAREEPALAKILTEAQDTQERRALEECLSK